MARAARQAGINALYLGQNLNDHKGYDCHHHQQDDQRVNHGAADFADNIGVFFLLVGQAFQAGIQRTGGFAGGYQADIDAVKDRRVLFKRSTKRSSGFDIGDNLVNDYFEGFVGGLLGDTAQALYQRQAGINQRR